jgi:beta-mannanase
VKAFLFKIFNKEFAFINKNLTNFIEKNDTNVHKILNDYQTATIRNMKNE